MNRYSYSVASQSGDYIKMRIEANYPLYRSHDDDLYGTFYATGNYLKIKYKQKLITRSIKTPVTASYADYEYVYKTVSKPYD